MLKTPRFPMLRERRVAILAAALVFTIFFIVHVYFSENRCKYSNSNSLSPDIQDSKLILAYTNWFREWPLDFSGCEYNCVFTSDKRCLNNAAVVLFLQQGIRSVTESGQVRDDIPVAASIHQYRALLNFESPGFTFNRMHSALDGLFNITLTYRRGSTIQYSIYQGIRREVKNSGQPAINYYAGKTKDMVAYVSNCQSAGYDRLAAMKDLSAYGLSLDLFGACGKPANKCHISAGKLENCEDDVVYKFYLSYENSLCEDYITEKFWKVLTSNLYMIPVVMGGKSIDDYTKVAPPNSFIHVENFASNLELAQYLKAVSADAALFNSYHRWRDMYKYEDQEESLPSCELCRIAHEKPNLPAVANLSVWWNENACRRSETQTYY